MPVLRHERVSRAISMSQSALETSAVENTNLVIRLFLPLVIVLTIFLSGCNEMSLMAPSMMMKSLQFETESEDRQEEFETAFEVDQPDVIEPPFIGEYVVEAGLNRVLLESVGLVTGLDGTGGDPPPSQYRTELLKDMRRREVQNPNRIISSPSTALVIVRGYLPALVAPGDRFDIEIRLPDGSETTSLNGGWLMECSLSERAIVPGRGVLEGKVRAKAKGPILVSTGMDESSSLLRRGRVVGGGIAFEKRDMYLYMKNDLRSVRNTTRVADRIGTRFFSYDEYGHREPLAEAKTDQKIVLSLHPTYKDNFNRYVQVIKNIAFRETEVARQVRMERLAEDILIPEKAEQAAIQLEAIGPDAIPMLRKALKADYFESRFHAAVALAYMGEPDGLEILYLAARDVPAFRVFAMVAMTVIDDGSTYVHFRELMEEDSMEIRYGAFRGLTTVDEDEPLVRGEELNDQCKLHVIPVGGEPMIHLTREQKAEIVLFGEDLRFKTPLALSAGPHIMVNCESGSKDVVVSRYQIGQPDQRKVVSANIAEVIRAAASMGASYPDLAQMLIQAEEQKNLPGRIGIDRLPNAGRVYYRPESPDGDNPVSGDGNVAAEKGRGRKVNVGHENLTPGPYFKTDLMDKDATKPLLTSELMEQNRKTGEPEDSAEEAPVAEETRKMKTEPEAEQEEPKKKRNPLKRLKQMLKPDTHGEFVYPDNESEED